MKATVGDRLVLASSVVDGPVRDGRIVEVRHGDGSPPYLVEWLDTGERTLVYPGPDAHVEADVGPAPAGEKPSQGGKGAAPAVTWRVQVTVNREGPETTAQAVLVSGDPDHVGASGRARRNPHDPETPVIGDEIAVARALHHLADRLIDTAEELIEDSTGRPARIHD